MTAPIGALSAKEADALRDSIRLSVDQAGAILAALELVLVDMRREMRERPRTDWHDPGHWKVPARLLGIAQEKVNEAADTAAGFTDPASPIR